MKPDAGIVGANGTETVRWVTLMLIWTVFVIHGIDRSVVLILLEPVRQEFGLNDTQIGLLSGLAYAVPFALFGIPVGALADRLRRTRLLAVLLGLWSLFTVLGGLAPTFPLLLLARAGVGASEAGAPPTMLSLIGDTFDARSRPAALSIYFTAPSIGLIAGSAIAGQLSQAHGWRTALLVVGAPGLLLSIIIACVMREPQRGRSDNGAATTEAPISIAATLRFIVRDKDVRRLISAIVLTAFVQLAVASWIPVFLQRIHGIGSARTGIMTAIAIGLTGIFGSVAGGTIAARFGNGDPATLKRLCGGAILLSVPLAIVAPLLGSPYHALICFGAWSFVGSAYMGPAWGIMIAAIPPHMRSTVMAVAVVTLNLIGAGFGPQSIGVLSDILHRLNDSAHLQHAMAVAPLIGILSAALFFRRSRSAIGATPVSQPA